MRAERRKVIIMGAAGRDFHNFNVFFRNNPNFEVVAFTAAQIPFIENRTYPPELAGPLYPNGIPIYPEEKLEELIERFDVDLVVLSYSDLSFQEVMEKASRVLAAGASFMLLGPKDTMLESTKPVVAVTATRTGCGKSPVTRYLVRNLEGKIVVVRHPMPYGDLRNMIVQRFEKYEDLEGCTIEEREEYEPLIRLGAVVYAGVDYEKILREAEKEADLIIWDGGNNDFPFFKPKIHITVVDPFRPGHEISYYPGMTNLLMADIVVISKTNTAPRENVTRVKENVRRWNPKAEIVEGRLEIVGPEVQEKKVVVVEDGPTITHGEMPFGAGYLWAEKLGLEVIDPRPYAVGTIKEAYQKYRHIGPVLPALGYSEKQIKELEETLRRIPAEAIISATPIDLSRLIKVDKPVYNVRYEYEDGGKLAELVREKL